MIAIDHTIQNSIDPVDISGVMRNRCLVEPVNDWESDKEGSSIRRIDDELDNDRDKKREENIEDQRFNYRQKQKTPCVSNAKYFNLKYNLLKKLIEI